MAKGISYFTVYWVPWVVTFPMTPQPVAEVLAALVHLIVLTPAHFSCPPSPESLSSMLSLSRPRWPPTAVEEIGMTTGDLSNCRSYFRSLVLSCVQVKHPGNIYWVLRYFHGPMGTVVGLSQVPLLAILNFWFFNPSPHSFSTYLLWDHLCLFLSLLPLFFPFSVSLSSFGILGGLVKPIAQSRHIGNAMGPLCNDTSSKHSPTLQHFVAQRLTEQEDVSFNFNRIWQIHFLLSRPKICFISISWTVATHKEKFLHICSINPDWVVSSSLWQ